MAKQAEVIAAIELAGKPQTAKQICKWLKASTRPERTSVAVCLSTLASQGRLKKAFRSTSDDFNGGKATVYWLPNGESEPTSPAQSRPDDFRELPAHLIPRVPRQQTAAPGIRITRQTIGQRFTAGPTNRHGNSVAGSK